MMTCGSPSRGALMSPDYTTVILCLTAQLTPAPNVLGMVARDSPYPQKPKTVRRGNWGKESFPHLQIGSLTREKVTEALEHHL